MEKNQIFFVPGGPGMDAGYFRYALYFVSDSFKKQFSFEFFDTAKVSELFDLDNLTAQLAQRLMALEKGTRVLCHSFGGCLIAECFKRFTTFPDLEIVFLNSPLDSTWLDEFDKTHRNSKIHSEIVQKISVANKEKKDDELCRDIFNAWLPFYFSEPESSIAIVAPVEHLLS
jgi:hypothetical protein